MAFISSKNYRLGFQLAALVVPVIMALAGVFWGDITPIARDFCSVVLPAGSLTPLPTDAGAPR